MYELWEFLVDDGSTIKAKFTREEIEAMMIKYPNVKWNDKHGSK